jgi:hypothetical protein
VVEPTEPTSSQPESREQRAESREQRAERTSSGYTECGRTNFSAHQRQRDQLSSLAVSSIIVAAVARRVKQTSGGFKMTGMWSKPVSRELKPGVNNNEK